MSHEQEQKSLFELALGRIFRMGARATQPGDIAEYERCRAICMDAAEELGYSTDRRSTQFGTHRPGWNRGVIE